MFQSHTGRPEPAAAASDGLQSSRPRRRSRSCVRGAVVTASLLAALSAGTARAQPAPMAPPAVGVVEASARPVTEGFEFIGRIEAVDRVNIVARVEAFLEEQLFTEGSEVRQGDLLYRLEKAPYQAEVALREAGVAQARAELTNVEIARRRAQQLQERGSGTQATLDDALARERTAVARLEAARAQVWQATINHGYTEITAPTDGRIGRSTVTVGNVVGPGSGTLATIVSQDPMHVTFPVPMRTAEDLRTRYAAEGGFEAMAIRLRLSDGRVYQHTGKLDFVDNTVGRDTDTLVFRGSVPNPLLPASEDGLPLRELADGQFVTVLLEAAEPVEQLTIPRESVLSDQLGDFVYVVGAGDIIERRPVVLGQSSPRTAVVLEGLTAGERIVLEGVQRVRDGIKVQPGPADVSTLTVDAS